MEKIFLISCNSAKKEDMAVSSREAVGSSRLPGHLPGNRKVPGSMPGCGILLLLKKFLS